MATRGPILRSSAVLSAATSAAEHSRSFLARFARPSSFSLPPNLSSASSRFSRNLSSFRAHYAFLLWLSLLAFLLPSHRSTALLLMLLSKAALSCAFLLRLFPSSPLLRRILARRVVFGVFLAVVMVRLVLAKAVVSLLLAIAAVAPVVAAHAVFRTADAWLGAGAVGESGKAAGEVALMFEKEADLEAGQGQGSDRSA